MLENLAGTSAYGLVRYDLKSYLPETVLSMPSSLSGVESTWTMQRFGQDGLALLKYDNYRCLYETGRLDAPSAGPFC